MPIILRRVSAGLVLAALLGVASCAINPVTGKNEIMLIPEATEIEMGKSTDQSIRKQFGLYEDPKLSAYVERVARRLVPHVHRKNLQYHFAVLDTPIENAFAAPGGYVYVTRGIMAMMNSEAELAAVLGHELGHVNARHSARQMSNQLLLFGGVLLASVLSEDVAKAAPFMLVGLQVLFLKFSRDDEYQADSLGVLYSRKGGYSPSQMIPFFGSIQKLEERAGGGLRPPNFLSTHPLTAKRIEEAKKMLEPGDAGLPVLRNEYLNSVNGLIVGDDPRQGYVEGSAFYNPAMKFVFDVPDDWVVQNSPLQVIAASKDEKAALILQAEASDKDPSTYLQEQLKAFADSQVNEVASGALRINGLAGYRGLYQVGPKPAADGTVASASQITTVGLDCIKKDGLIYTFLGMSAKPDYPNYESRLVKAVRSFRPLTDRAKLSVQPRRLTVRTAPRSATLKDLLTEMKMPEKSWKTLEFLNSVALGETVAKGRLVKILN